MKKHSLFLLAGLMLSSALYAQDNAAFSQEQILAFFEAYNPVVLEKAQQNEGYRVILDNFVAGANGAFSQDNQVELIAAVRNFENSIRLQLLNQQYGEQMTLAKISGRDVAPIRKMWQQETADVMADVWAVTVSLRQEQLKDAKKALKKVRSDKTLSADQKNEQTDKIQKDIKSLKENIRSLKKNSGELILSFADAYVEKQEKSVLQNAYSQSLQASQTTNLNVKANHKKPVAK